MSGQFERVDEVVLHGGFIFDLVRAEFRSPEGELFRRDIVRHPGAVSVVPIDADGRVIMVRQYRPALDRVLLEIPAGKRDVAGEPPELTAQRELGEEIGRYAGSLELLGSFANAPGFSDELSWIYLGQDLEIVPRDVQGIEESHLIVEKFSFSEAFAMIANGLLIDTKTIVGLFLAASRVGGG
ncbi:MAG: NUDIX hydrolase [Acidimicrobiales bacterium]